MMIFILKIIILKKNTFFAHASLNNQIGHCALPPLPAPSPIGRPENKARTPLSTPNPTGCVQQKITHVAIPPRRDFACSYTNKVLGELLVCIFQVLTGML